jgi:hypothetical protein
MYSTTREGGMHTYASCVCQDFITRARCRCDGGKCSRSMNSDVEQDDSMMQSIATKLVIHILSLPPETESLLVERTPKADFDAQLMLEYGK